MVVLWKQGESKSAYDRIDRHTVKNPAAAGCEKVLVQVAHRSQ